MPGSALIGNLAVNLSLETATFQQGANIAEKRVAAMGKRMSAFGDKLMGMGKSLTAFVTLPLAGLAAAGIKEARETAQAMGQVNAALKSMGPVAGKTASQLEKAANAFEKSSLFEADQILQKVTANMLTFGNISGQAFDRAQQAAIDLSARLGQDLQSSAIMVGKALNDPAKGLAALRRVGIQFTEQQETQIKAMMRAGNAAGAQAVMLKELERQFGGAAQAAQDADPFNKVTDAFKEMAEAVGTALLPLIPPLTDAVVKLIGYFTSLSPATQKWVIIIGGVMAVLGPVLIGLGALATAIGAALPLLAAMKVALLAIFANPIVLGAAAVIGGIYLAWKNWDKIVEIVQRVYQGVKKWIGDALGRIIDAAGKKVRELAGPFAWLYDKVVGNSYVPDMVLGIAREMAKLEAVMVKPAKAATDKVAEAFRALRDLLAELYPEAEMHNQYLANLATLDEALKKGRISADQYADALERLKIARDKVVIDRETLTASDGTDILGSWNLGGDRRLNPLEEWARTIPQTAAEITEALQGIVAYGLDDIADGIADVITGAKSLKDAFADVAKSIIADLIRMAARMLIFRALSSAFPGLFPTPIAGTRAMGGPVSAGRTYLVGERGPELLRMGNTGGQVVPNHALGGGGKVEIILRDEMLDARIQGGAGVVVQRAYPAIQAGVHRSLREHNRRR